MERNRRLSSTDLNTSPHTKHARVGRSTRAVSASAPMPLVVMLMPLLLVVVALFGALNWAPMGALASPMSSFHRSSASQRHRHHQQQQPPEFFFADHHRAAPSELVDSNSGYAAGAKPSQSVGPDYGEPATRKQLSEAGGLESANGAPSASGPANEGADDNDSASGDDQTGDGATSSSSSFESEREREREVGAADSSHEAPERNPFLSRHNSQLQAMQNMFERRQLNNQRAPTHHAHGPLQSSQELSPISIGLDPVVGPGFSMPPFPHDPSGSPGAGMGHPKPPGPMANADNLDQGLGPALPFGLSPLPHLLGFQNSPFDGPQRGDQSAHTNHHAAVPAPDPDAVGPSQKVWPKIFRFTDGRINLSDFEKQKKIRLSNKNQHNTENHIESAPIMFDGRQLKRKSFLILHGGIFSRR